jgi:hypothetical protein
MCHRLGRERDRVLGVEASGDLEARRDLSTSTRLVPPRAKCLRSPGVFFFFFGVVFCGVAFLFGVASVFAGFAGFRGIFAVPRAVSSSALNLRGATRTRADLGTA